MRAVITARYKIKKHAHMPVGALNARDATLEQIALAVVYAQLVDPPVAQPYPWGPCAVKHGVVVAAAIYTPECIALRIGR